MKKIVTNILVYVFMTAYGWLCFVSGWESHYWLKGERFSKK